jgi:hypothetical protein
MVPLDNRDLYEASLRLLYSHTRSHKGASYPGRLVQIFLAAKYASDRVPVVGSGPGLPTGELQATLDAIYTKRARLTAGQPSVVSLFNNEHLYRTGTIAGHLTSASNIWRNNFQLQKAMICYAPEVELQDPNFVMAPRAQCPHLRPDPNAAAGTLFHAQCEFKLGTHYRGEDRAKFLRRDPASGAISVVAPTNIALWQNAIVPTTGKLPVVPLICALYHDSDISSGRVAIEPEEFMLDFNFSPEEYHAFFEDDPASDVHTQLTNDFPGISWTRVSAPVSALPTRVRKSRRRILLSALPLTAPAVAPPSGTQWWAAEQAVQQVLRDSGWTVIDRSRQGVGFDLEARQGNVTLYVEVKSSSAACSPTLTGREYEAACHYGNRYILAIVENFDPKAPVRVLWVPHPAALGLSSRDVREYLVPRSRWLSRAQVSLPR